MSFAFARRAGNSAMMARRCSSLIDSQPPISFTVRPQPVQSPLLRSTTQMRTQGLEMFGVSVIARI